MADQFETELEVRLEHNSTGGYQLVEVRTGKPVLINGVRADALTEPTAKALSDALDANRNVPLPR